MIVAPTSTSYNPGLQPVFSITLAAEEGIPLLSNKQESITVVKVKSGEIVTLDPKYPFDAKVEFGYDDLTTKNEAKSSTLDCKLYARTPNGSGARITYTGVTQTNDAAIAVLTGKKLDMEYGDMYLTCNPVVNFDSGVEDKYKWVANENLIGKGRFIRDDKHGLYVQYIVYRFASN